MHRVFSMAFAVAATACVLISAAPAHSSSPRAGARKAPSRADKFYLKDGDRVVFYGDSITDQRLYTTYIESYCVTRFPQRHFTFVHSGWGGDRVTGGGGGPIDVRLKRDVLPYNPTVVTICLGMNDASYRAFDPGIFDTYVKGYRHILDTLKEALPNARFTLLTAPAYDDVTRAPGFPGGYNATLKRYGEAVADLAREYKATLADTNAPLVDALEKGKTENAEVAARLIPDRVHPQHGGHMVMASAVLRAWNAPATVADITIDAGRRRASAIGSTITQLKRTSGGLSFTRLDSALPWPLDRDPKANRDMALALQVTKADQEFNWFTLKVTGLPAGKYALKVDGNEITQVTADDLKAGLNLADIPNLPSNEQAHEVLALTYKHNNLHFHRWREVQFPVSKAGEEPPAEVKAQMAEIDQQDAAAAAAQHEAAQPKPHTMEILPVL